MKDPDLLASFPRSAFILADNAMYQPIYKVGTQIGIFRR
jgi:phosphonate transport system substrate-binding protein